jgi:hypothetical protein
MKKILILLMLAICCYGCSRDVDTVKCIETHSTNVGYFTYVQYDGHEYLIWRNGMSLCGITHSPKCHCQNK